MNISQADLLKEYYLKHPKRNIPHHEIVDWVTQEYTRRTGKVFRDPDRGIRKLFQEGFLIKVSKGVYQYDPEFLKNKELEDFTPEQKKIILERDGYRCVICGAGSATGAELHIDHIKPKHLGGRAVIENGQVLCATHNFRKKTTGQTETGKKMFIRLYELTKEEDPQLSAFCEEVLKLYEKHNINGQIQWKK